MICDICVSIEWEPLVPEPIYRLTGLEEEPACTDPLESKVIYQVSEGLYQSSMRFVSGSQCLL